MPDDPTSLDDLASRLRAAMDAADVEAIAKLLDPEVRWGPPDDPAFGCHNRSEVLAWWQRSADEGMRARVTEVVVGADKLLIGFKVTGTEAAVDHGGEADRWQVVAVRDGKVTDIRGFDDREVAAARAGIR